MNDTMWPPMGAGARLSADGVHRYELTRRWGKGPCVCWVMLNPSTADATQDDATIRKCIAFSKKWDMGALVVVNLFSFRATDPRELMAARRSRPPIDITGGLDNDVAIHDAMVRSRMVVAAWGTRGGYLNRAYHVGEITTMRTFLCLGTTKDGFPRHPLRLAYETQLRGLATI